MITNPMENIARLIFAQAIDEERAGDLLDCLIEGGSATIDGHTGRLVLVSPEQLEGLKLHGDDTE